MEYQQLKQEQNEIRLVTILPLQPGADASVIHCELQHVSLLRPPSYTALSYCWGDPNVTREIMVNGHSFQVTTNLYLALAQLRETSFNILWIDAICIHQEDLVEKSTQLLLMGSIYRKAEMTIAWFGVIAIEENDLLQNGITNIGTREDTHNISKYDLGTSIIILKLLSSMFNDPYWHRVWIIQELALSEKIFLWWTKGSLELSNLESAIKTFKGRPSVGYNDTDHIDFGQMERVLRFRTDMVSERPMSFLDALSISHASLASEDRDKAFALLNITFNGSRYIPIPDYSRSVEELCLEITMTAVKATRSLDLLVLFANIADESRPSWQPNWMALSNANGNVQWKMEYALREMIWPKDLDFHTCDKSNTADFWGSWKRDYDAVTSPDFKGASLRVKGCLIPKSRLFVLSSDINGSPGGVDGAQNREAQIPAEYRGVFLQNTLFKRLFFTLCILGGATYGRNGTFNVVYHSDSDVLRNLWPGQMDQNRQKHPEIFKWFEANQNLPLWGNTLGYWLKCRAQGELKKVWLDLVYYIRDEEGSFFDLDSKRMPDYLRASLEWGMRFVVTEDGHIGWVDAKAGVGDQIAWLDDCTFPVVLRPREEGGWRVVGWCFIHGYMDDSWPYTPSTTIYLERLDLY